MTDKNIGDKLGKLAAEHKDTVQSALQSDQAEEVSDKVLDSVSGFAKKVTGGKFDEQIEGARDSLDGMIGNEGQGKKQILPHRYKERPPVQYRGPFL